LVLFTGALTIGRAEQSTAALPDAGRLLQGLLEGDL